MNAAFIDLIMTVDQRRNVVAFLAKDILSQLFIVKDKNCSQ